MYDHVSLIWILVYVYSWINVNFFSIKLSLALVIYNIPFLIFLNE